MSAKLTSNSKQGLDRLHHCAKQQDPIWFGSEWESRNQFQWKRIGYNQAKYRSRKLMSNPKQGCLNMMHHCTKQQYPMWFEPNQPTN